MSIVRRTDAEVMSELRALGSMCRVQGDLKRAEQHFRLALRLYETSFGESHLDAVICLFGLQQVLNETGRVDEAEQLDHVLELMNARRRVAAT